MQIKSQVGFPAWVEVDEKKFTGTFKQLPDREEILPEINENLVVELYSKVIDVLAADLKSAVGALDLRGRLLDSVPNTYLNR